MSTLQYVRDRIVFRSLLLHYYGCMRLGLFAAMLLTTWATPPAPLPAAFSPTQGNAAGTWRGRSLNRTRDSILVHWTWVNGADGTGAITFADEMSAIPTRLISATTDSVIFELLQPLAGPDSAMLRFAGRPGGDSLAGEIRVRVRDGRMGRRPFDGVRVGPVPAFERKECPFAVATGHVECGWLVVPEARSRPQGRTVRLNVVVGRATRPTGAPVLVYISGGPGQTGAPARYNPGLVAIQRDVVYYDQRGTGASQPALCPEFSGSYAANRNSDRQENWLEGEKPFIRRCIDSLRAQGIDRESYNTSTSAHDLADLRRALGYQRVILRGGSYGTRLAQEAMRNDPLGVHAAVLIAPAPPGNQDDALKWRLSIQHTLEKLFAACAADTDCHTVFPDPEADFNALWEELSREPIRTLASNGRDTVVLHGDRLVSSLVGLFDGTTNHARIPFLLHELRRGDRMRAARELAPDVAGIGGIAVAFNRLVNCYEAGVRQQSTLDSVNVVPKPPFRMKLEAGACELWRTRFASASESAPLRSDIPTLIITGEYDLRTPVEDARRIASTLSHAYVVVLPGMGHSGMPVCGLGIVGQFLENPTRQPDTTCLTQMPKLSFPTAWQAPPRQNPRER
jgi:pimeloyl-ACP methyl ester carboxylesterase